MRVSRRVKIPRKQSFQPLHGKSFQKESCHIIDDTYQLLTMIRFFVSLQLLNTLDTACFRKKC